MAGIKKNIIPPPTGTVLIATLVMSLMFIVMAGGLAGLVNQQRKLAQSRTNLLTALQIAEAGANYYRWHLAHAPTDYADGTGQTGCNPCGPYTHNYLDPGGALLGQFSLEIKPPATSTTIVKIKSTGWTASAPNTKRYLAVRYGRPSWAKYSVLANTDIRFGAGTTVNGPLHSNGGIRFDGIAYNEVTSGVNTYNDNDSDACTVSSWGVHTCVDPDDPSPQTVPPDRTDVFVAGRRYPVPVIDFNSITVDLSNLESTAGLVINKSNFEGWHLQFLGSNNIQYRKVRTTSNCVYSCGGSCSVTVPNGNIGSYQGNWTNTTIPANGVIFIKDNLWVDGTIGSNVRVTLVAAEEPFASGDAKIWINNDILYTLKDGTNAIGLIAQDDISVGLFSEDNLEIDAAMLSQKGRVGREYYPSSCSSTYYKQDTITIFGTIATAERYGFSWICGTYCSGYETRNINFDSHLTYSPPPSFPVSGEFDFISWEEIFANEAY